MCILEEARCILFKGSAAQKVVLLISILEHAASLVRVACACNSPGVRGWGCCSGPRAPVARFGVWRRPCAARLLPFFLQRKTTLLPLKYTALPLKYTQGTSGRTIWPPCPPRVPGTPGESKHAPSFQQSDFQNKLPSLTARAVTTRLFLDFFMWIF